LGRYGHQPADQVLDMTTTDLQQLADSVAEILKEEGDATRGAADGG
jgi:ElaB/YqjD/DUF883 family membrane-anchored ribosome-binding protein